MKPTKVRLMQLLNKQICAPISKDLRKKYSRRSARIMLDDTVKVIRGEYKGITGKISKISTERNSIAIEGNKKEKLKGDKVDVYIHTTNVIITALNTDDKWRLKILEKKPKSKIKSMKEEAKKKDESKPANKKKDESKPANKKKDESKPANKKKDESKPANKKTLKNKSGDK
jgi:large subunit ribosomal protein L24